MKTPSNKILSQFVNKNKQVLTPEELLFVQISIHGCVEKNLITFYSKLFFKIISKTTRIFGVSLKSHVHVAPKQNRNTSRN